MDANVQTAEADCGTSTPTDTPQGNVAPQSYVDSQREETAPIEEDHWDLKKDNVCGDPKKSPSRPVESEDTNMKRPSEVTTDMEAQDGTNVGLSRQNPTCAGNALVSSADDLDEMMDIGTVDQVDQEAQMTEQPSSLEGENAQDQVVSNAGKLKQSFCFCTKE